MAVFLSLNMQHTQMGRQSLVVPRTHPISILNEKYFYNGGFEPDRVHFFCKSQ